MPCADYRHGVGPGRPVRREGRRGGHSRCFFEGQRPHLLKRRLARGGGLRKELTEWRSVAVTAGLARRDRAKEEGRDSAKAWWAADASKADIGDN